jgi:two-component system, OmpR family, aerobic respiration control sensor histidine kinase ArcB
MRCIKHNAAQNKDILWLFRGFDKAAFFLSSDYRIIELTPAAAKLFVVIRKKVLGKSISSLFSSLKTQISFSKKGNKTIVKLKAKGGTSDLHKANMICNLNWQVKSRFLCGDKADGLVLYVDKQTDVEQLSQEYKLVTGQDKIIGASARDYAEGIRSYLEDIIVNMPGYIYWVDKNGVCLGCNDNDAQLFGFKSRKELVGLSCSEAKKKMGWLTESLDAGWKDHLDVIATGKPKLNIEDQPILMPNGKEMFLSTSRVPLFDKNKNVIGVLGMTIDITDRKLMEQELQLARERADRAEKELLAKMNKEITGQVCSIKQSPVAHIKNIQSYLESIIACLPGNVYWLDRNLVYLGCNDNEAKFLGLKSRKDIIGLAYKDIGKTAPWLVGRTTSWVKSTLEVIATGRPILGVDDGPFLMPNGVEANYLTNLVPLFDDNNNVIGVVGVSIDISGHKKLEKLQKEQAIVEKTSKFMKMLSGSIAHELRTPLAIVGVSADLLSISPAFVGADDDEKILIEKRFKSIKYAIKSASCIIDSMMIVLKTLSSGVNLNSNLKRLAIADDINNLLQSFPLLDHEKSLFVVEFGTVKDFFYNGDKILTQYMLSNLIRNSLHAIKEAEKGEIKISLGTSSSYNILKFIDTALGISVAELSDIFNQFTSKKQLGSGLGLAFCKEVMQIYGGDISCNSKLGEYTEFVLRFPKIT